MTLAITLDRLPQFKSKLEKDYWLHLTMLQHEGGVRAFNYEQITFVIGVGAGSKARYTPDFCVISEDNHVEFHETKGSKAAKGQKAAIVRLKAAAMAYPWARWFLVTRDKGGDWEHEEFKA